MKRRLVNLLAAVSLLLCAATLMLWVASLQYNIELIHSHAFNEKGILRYSIEPWEGQLRFCRSKWAVAPMGRDDGTAYPKGFRLKCIKRSATAEASASVGFELHSNTRFLPPGYESAYVAVPLWFAACLFAVVPLVQCFRTRLVISQRDCGLCAACGYDLRASKERCPECGTAIAEMQKAE